MIASPHRAGGFGLIPSVFAILTLSTLTSLGMFFASEAWLRPGRANPAPGSGLLSHAQPCSHSPVPELCHLSLKQLSRARQDMFCADVHPVSQSGERALLGVGLATGGHAFMQAR